MTGRQWKKLDVLGRVSRSQLTMIEAAQILGLSARQMGRLRQAFEERGDACVVHGNVGRPPSNRVVDEQRTKIVALRRGAYDGFNDHHFAEELQEDLKVTVSRSTVRRILRAAGIPSPQTRRGRKLRRRRERKPQMGMMLLWDGSKHEWLEGRGPALCLVGAIDDATGQFLPGAHFVENECAIAYLRVLRAICKTLGIPLSIYMDRHSSLKRNDSFWSFDEELAGSQEATQVARALAELNIEPIYALSPQAKGRVERLWRTLQDRLTSELRRAGARTLDDANRVLNAYRPKFNRRFGVASREAEQAWQTVPKECDLDEICAFRIETTVNHDNTVQKNGVRIDLEAGPDHSSLATKRAEVRQLLTGEVRVYVDGVLRGRAWGNPPTHAPRRLRVAKHRPKPKATAQPATKKKLSFKQILKKHRRPAIDVQNTASAAGKATQAHIAGTRGVAREGSGGPARPLNFKHPQSEVDA